jgi:DNA processing protein
MHTLPLAQAELTAWLRLTMTQHVSRHAVRAWLAAFGLPQQILAASHAALAEIAGPAAAMALLDQPGPEFANQHAMVLDWLAQPGNQVVTLADPAYPRTLLDGGDPPLLLYVKGRLDLLHASALAIVGSRHASPQGLATARAFASELGAAGLTIVSGLALGIDAAAHEGALDTSGGTVAVVGTGADLVYPARHHALARQLALRGTLLSEWPLGTPARKAHFPQRNRLIAGLARGVFVVEAASQSGSLITARLANEMGRDVYAMPGSIHSALTKGCHRLIKDGAKLVESVADILQELGWSAPACNNLPAPACALPVPTCTTAAHMGSIERPSSGRSPQPHNSPTPAGTATTRTAAPTVFSSDALAALSALGHDRAAPDLLAKRTGLSASRLQAALLELELGGAIAPLPCGRVEPFAGGVP